MRILTNLFFICFIVFMSSSCSETKSASQPSILGTPPKSSYFDVYYEYEFGADGGDGILSYRLVSAPDWLNLETINGAKPSFKIFGTPVFTGDSEEFKEYVDTEFEIVIEVSDGARTVQETFTVVQMRNAVIFGQPKIRATEGEESEDIYTGVFDERCDIPDFSPRYVGGRLVYPYPMVVVLENPAESRTKLKLVFGSSYNSAKDENDSSNLRVARPGVDYVDEEKTITLEAGVSACLTMVDIFDDSLIEGEQLFDVTITEVLEGWVEMPGKGDITIVDDEPELVFEGASEYVTEGKTSQTYTYELSEAVDYEISVDLHAAAVSTAKPEDYTINPNTLIFPANTTKATFSVDIEDDGDNDPPPAKGPGSLDEVVVVEAEVASVFELTPLTITINEWATEIQTASLTAGAVSNAVVIDAESDVVVLNTDNNEATLIMFDRVGNPLPFTSDPAESVITSGGNETAVDAAYITAANASRDIYVVLNTSGYIGDEVGGVNKGDQDVVVRKYSRFTGSRVYGVEWTKQFGSTEEDLAAGIEVDVNGNVYVFGTTKGSLETGVSNKGQKDAFIYVYKEDGSFAWSRMLGSTLDDVPTGVVSTVNFAFLAGYTQGVIAGASSVGSVDAFEAQYRVDGTFQSVRQWGTVYDDYVTATTGNEFQRWSAGHTKGDLTQQNSGVFDSSVPRNSIDSFFLNYDLLNQLDGLSMFGDSSLEDQAVAIRSIGSTAIVGGFTKGVLSGQVSAGGDDAYLVGLNSEVIDASPEWVAQFGGAGDDSVISMADQNLNKLMVLWKKSDGGLTTYQLKPIESSTGRDLTQ